MNEHWEPLVANFAIVALFISSWVNGQWLLAGSKRLWRQAAFGATMGLGTVASMLFAIDIDGALFDLRSTVIGIAGFFGGPIAGLVAIAIAAICRLGFVGGPTAGLGLISMVLSALTGVAVSRLTRKKIPALMSAVILALAVPVVTLTFTIGVSMMLAGRPPPISFPVAFMNMAATAISALFIMHRRVLERERDLLRAGFEQSPDFQYVKHPNLEFAAVNFAAALHNNFAKPADMVGKSDFDIAPGERASALMLAERKVIETGRPLINFEEEIEGPDGDPIWYVSSKFPVHNSNGEVIGLAGVTRDVTAEKRLKLDISESRDRLNYVLSEISDGIALYDSQGTLAYCNQQFARIFPLTSVVRRSGQHIRDILQAVVETKEQKGIPVGNEDRWIDAVAATLAESSGRDVELYDGRWLHIKTRPTTNGSSIVVVSDITTMKQAEEALRSMTEQLKLLATTDGLTGLTNRRAFDQALETEMARCRRSGEPLALLLADVDKFKTYNDVYGHLAGDEALKTTARCLREALKRPADVAARYGGEEFVAILPSTDEDGAFFIADAFRENLKALGVPHTGADKGVLTVSVGIAVFTEADAGINATELIRRADEALYTAKGGGRDRVTGWRRKYEPQPVRAASPGRRGRASAT